MEARPGRGRGRAEKEEVSPNRNLVWFCCGTTVYIGCPEGAGREPSGRVSFRGREGAKTSSRKKKRQENPKDNSREES